MWWYFSSSSINLSAIYRITAVLKVETDIIVSIAACPTERAVILVITYVKTFKIGVIVFNRRSQNVFDITMTDNFQYQSVLAHESYELT